MQVDNVIITGTSQGLGKALAFAALSRGGKVVGISRGASDISHDGYHHYRADLASAADADAAVVDAVGVLGDQDVVLINNAGVYTSERLPELTAEAVEASVRANVSTALNATNAVMERFARARCVYIGGENALKPSEGSGAYGTAKLALLRLVQSLRLEADASRFEFMTVFAPTISTWTDDVVEGAIVPADAAAWIIDQVRRRDSAVVSHVDLGCSALAQA